MRYMIGERRYDSCGGREGGRCEGAANDANEAKQTEETVEACEQREKAEAKKSGSREE